MIFQVCRIKIMGLVVKAKNLYYKEGSISLSEELIEEAGILNSEILLALNLNTGDRFFSHSIPDKQLAKKEVILNGPAARCGEVGDELIILATAWITEEERNSFKPKIIHV